MTTVSETTVMKTIEDELDKIQDPAARERILRWAWDKFTESKEQMSGPDSKKAKVNKKRATPRGGGDSSARTKATPPSIVKDLNLKPQGKESFADFIKKKEPTSQHAQCLVAYYLRNTAAVKAVGTDHVYTCFKVAGWRVPANLRNVMQVAASTKGWLDTSNMSDIKVTIHGDNYIEHDLKPKSSAKS